jgi:hypothetical protein
MREKSLFVPIESPQLHSALFNPFLGHFSRGGSIIGSFYTQSLEVICSISRSGEYGRSNLWPISISTSISVAKLSAATLYAYDSDRCRVEISGRELFA